MKFQDKFKEAYTQDDADWDKDAMWTSIEKELPPKKKKRRFFILFFGLGMVLIGSVIGFIYFSNNELDTDSISDKTIEKNIENDAQIMAETKEIDVVENKRDDENKLEEAGLIVNTTNVSPVLDHSHIASSTNSTLIETQTQLSDPKRILSHTENNDLSLFHFENKAFSKNEDLDEIKDFSFVDAGRIDKTKLSESMLYFRDIQDIRWHQLKHIRDLKILDMKPEVYTEEMLHHPKNLTFVLKMYGGYTNQSLSSGSSLNDDFVDLHAASKRLQETLGAEFLFRKRFGSHFSFGIGLSYFSSFEWYNGQSIDIEQNEVATDTARYFVVSGFVNYVTGKLTQTTSTTTKYQSPVRRNQLDVPFEIGYELKLSRVKLLAFAKYNFNVMNGISGRIYSTDLNLLESSESEIVNMYKSNWVNSYMYGIDAALALGQNYSVALGVYHRKQLTTPIVTTLGIDEKYSSTGISIGLLYTLN